MIAALLVGHQILQFLKRDSGLKEVTTTDTMGKIRGSKKEKFAGKGLRNILAC